MAVYDTKHFYIILTVIVILILMIITIAQLNRQRLQRIVVRYMPESELNRLIKQQYIQWKIACRRTTIEHERCIGNGQWSNVYAGNVQRFEHAI